MPGKEVLHIKSEGHSICFGSYCLAKLAEMLGGTEYTGVKIFILADEHTLKHCLPVLTTKVAALRSAELLEVAAGEASKSIEIAAQLWKVMGELGADRHSLLINLGGGMVSDLGGFVAGTFKRGIRFINLPTSLLAQVDASIGGKTGINHGGLKNEVGLFRHPESVFIDPDFLDTLPRRERIAGFAEMIKHALIASSTYWQELQELSLFDREALAAAIPTSIHIKNEIVCSDPFEAGRRKLLNFGHSIGHALESFSHESDVKPLLHGEAIAMGMICESYISHKLKLLSEEHLHEITSFILSHFTRVQLDAMYFHRIVALMQHDKKNRGGLLNFSLLHSPGDAIYDMEAQAEVVIESLHYYNRWVG